MWVLRTELIALLKEFLPCLLVHLSEVLELQFGALYEFIFGQSSIPDSMNNAVEVVP